VTKETALDGRILLLRASRDQDADIVSAIWTMQSYMLIHKFEDASLGYAGHEKGTISVTHDFQPGASAVDGLGGGIFSVA
jgi:hypothetical protein